MTTLIWTWLLAACGTPPEPTTPPPPPPVVEDPSGVTLIGPDALAAMLQQAPGRVRVVNFWATWCGPCIAELPTIRDWAAANPEVDVVLVNVDVPSLHDRKVVPFVRQHGLDAVRNLQLDDPDPAMALARVVADWPDAIPVTQVHRADGTRAAFFTRAVTASDLTQAVASAR